MVIAHKLGIPNRDYEIKIIERQNSDHSKHTKKTFGFSKKKISKKGSKSKTKETTTEKKKVSMYFPQSISKSANAYCDYDTDDENITHLQKKESVLAIDYPAQEILFKKIKEIYETNFKSLMIFLFIFLTLNSIGTGIILEHNKEEYQFSNMTFDSNFEKTHVISTNKKWMVINPFDKVNLALDFTEFLLLIYIITKASFLWKFDGIFKINYKIYYCTIILLTIGVLPNVIFFFFFFMEKIFFFFF